MMASSGLRMYRTFPGSGKVRARKTHTCTRCGTEIAQGEVYNRFVGLLEGDFAPAKLHLRCPLPDVEPERYPDGAE